MNRSSGKVYKFRVENCEVRVLFQRTPDDAVHRGLDKHHRTSNLSGRGNFIKATFLKPLTAREQAREITSAMRSSSDKFQWRRWSTCSKRRQVARRVCRQYRRPANRRRGSENQEPCYLQDRPDMVRSLDNLRRRCVGCNCNRKLNPAKPILTPVGRGIVRTGVTIPTDREAGIRSLAVFTRSLHSQELPSLIMELRLLV